MTIVTSGLGVVNFDDPRPTSERPQPRDTGKREISFVFSVIFDVAFVQLG